MQHQKKLNFQSGCKKIGQILSPIWILKSDFGTSQIIQGTGSVGRV